MKNIVYNNDFDLRSTFVLEVSPTTLCNRRCKHCFIPEKELGNKAVIDPSKLLRVTDVVIDFMLEVAEPSNLAVNPMGIKPTFDCTFLGGELLLLDERKNIEFVEIIKHILERVWSSNHFFVVENNFVSNLLPIRNIEMKLGSVLSAMRKTNTYFENLSSDYIQTLPAKLFLNSSFEVDTGRFRNPKELESFIEISKMPRNFDIENILIVTLTRGVCKINPEAIKWLFGDKGGFDYFVYDMFHSYGTGEIHENALHPSWEQFNKTVLAYILHRMNVLPNNLVGKGGTVVEDKVGVPLCFVGISPYSVSFIFNGNVPRHIGDYFSVEIDTILDVSDPVDFLIERWHQYRTRIISRTMSIKQCRTCDLHKYCQSGFYGNVFGFGNPLTKKMVSKEEKCPIYPALKAMFDQSNIEDFVKIYGSDIDKWFDINLEDIQGKSIQEIFEIFSRC